MLRRIAGFCSVAALLGMAPLVLAQDFSADVVSNKQANSGPSKLYCTKDKVRWELGERNPGAGPTALVLDEAAGKSFVLIEQKHIYMDSLPWMTKTPVVTQFWHVSDVNEACPQWKKIAEQTKGDQNWGSCSKVGSDTVNGRSAVKYEGVSKQGDKSYYWLDAKLKCVIKTESDSGTFELKNIQEASQPASLFEVPAGYTKMDFGGMMKRPQ